MGIIGSAFIGYNRVYGAGENRSLVNEMISESLFYYDVSNTNSYSFGDNIIQDLSPNSYDSQAFNTGSNFRSGSDGDIVYISNGGWNSVGENISPPDSAIVNGDFSSSGVSMNFWVQPQEGQPDTSPPFGETLQQVLFSAYVGGTVPWSFGILCAANVDTPASILLRLGNRGDENNQTDNFEYVYSPTSPSPFKDEYRMMTFTWTNGESCAMYLDGVKVKSGSTSKSWNSGAIVNSSTFLLGYNGGTGANVSKVSSGFTIDRVLTDFEVSTYYNQTKAFFNR